jgi:hypothetical protein
MPTVKTTASPVVYVNFLNSFPQMYTIEEYSFLGVDKMLVEREIYGKVIDSGAPSLFYHSNGYISPIASLTHDDVETQRLNDLGVNIYLLEPLCYYILGDRFADTTEFNNSFYSEFPNQEISTDLIRSKELDSIVQYVKHNRLTRVTVYTCDYKVAEYLTHYTEFMKLECDDWFIKKLILFDNYQLPGPKTFRKKFLCLNWRFTTARCIVSSYLVDKECYLSWNYDMDPAYFDKVIWLNDPAHVDFKVEYSQKLKQLNMQSPLIVDLQLSSAKVLSSNFSGHAYPETQDSVNPTTHNQYFSRLKQYYQNVFLDVVTESRYAQPTANVSEKTTQAMVFMTPFVLVAPPNSLEYLKVLGYKTFSNWWDETYDTQTDHVMRLKMIFKLLDYIQTLSKDDLSVLYNEMLPVLEHNQQHFIKNRIYDVQPSSFLSSIEGVEKVMTQVQPVSNSRGHDE